MRRTATIAIAFVILVVASQRSVSQEKAAPVATTPVKAPTALTAWGPRVQTQTLKNLYGPREIKEFTATPGGIDNLSLSATDVFFVPGKGEVKVDFKGYFRVARDNPTTKDWATANFFVNMTDIYLRGESPELGAITVGINPNAVSSGQVLAAGAAQRVAACRIAVGAQFKVAALNTTLFNKEPILLMNDGIKAVPPLEDPNGSAHIFNLPLYDVKNPQGHPVAYLRSIKYTVGNYITLNEAKAFREQERRAFTAGR